MEKKKKKKNTKPPFSQDIDFSPMNEICKDKGFLPCDVSESHLEGWGL
jgi:hypothetical protein